MAGESSSASPLPGWKASTALLNLSPFSFPAAFWPVELDRPALQQALSEVGVPCQTCHTLTAWSCTSNRCCSRDERQCQPA